MFLGETTATIEEQAKAAEGIKHEIFSHWHPNVTINLVNDYTPWVSKVIKENKKIWLKFIYYSVKATSKFEMFDVTYLGS